MTPKRRCASKQTSIEASARWATSSIATTSKLGAMTGTPSAGLRSPDVASRLGINGRDVYRLIFAGELDGRPDADGIVFTTAASVEAYLEANGRGYVSNNLTTAPRRPVPHDGERTAAEASADLHEPAVGEPG